MLYLMLHRSALLVIFFLRTFTIGIEPVAGEKRLGQDGPPLNYQLNDVTISVVTHPGNPAFGRRTVQLIGDGTCRVTTTKPSFSHEPHNSKDDPPARL